MAYLISSMVNFVIGMLSQLPKQEISIDLVPLNDYLGIINYFIPFYLIYPIFLGWCGFIAVFVTSTQIWGLIKRHL